MDGTMTNDVKKKLALFILEGIIVFTAIPLLSALHHFVKGLFQ
jgi:hypothetical protein